MDLVATVARRRTQNDHGEGQVGVWRLNGQCVFEAQFERGDTGGGGGGVDEDDTGQGDDDDSKRNEEDEEGWIRGLAWRRDGQMLAVACADSTVALINAFTGKIAHRITTAATVSQSSSSSQSQSQSQSSSKSPRPHTPSSTPTCISWNTHFAAPTSSAIRTRLEGPDSQVTLDEILGLRADVDKLLRMKADLPRELGALDIEVSLPKLATLPPLGVGSDDDIFSSRSSIDAVFHANGQAGSGHGDSVDRVDALLVGLQSDNGGHRCAVHIRIFDSFEIGTVDVGACLPGGSKGGKVVKIESHPFLSTALLVVEQMTDDGPATLHLLGLDMSFISQTGRHLPVVAKKATQLGNLLRYVAQIHTQLASEVKAAFDLPGRFLRNINEYLGDGDDYVDFVHAAHHLAVTGECDGKLKEWLVDEVGERGLKRWEKAVGDCLDIVRRLTSECLMPALERCQVVLTRLDGLAQFGPTSSRLGLEEKNVRKVMETVNALGILAEDLLADVKVEIVEFTAFMKWLKWECEVEALEETSERAAELRESWTGENELLRVLDYVGGAMKDSRIKKYIVPDGPEQSAGALIEDDTDAGFFLDYMKRRAAPPPKAKKNKSMPTFGQVVGRLQTQAERVFAQIAETFRKSILPSHMLEFPRRCDGRRLDLRIVPDVHDRTIYRLYCMARDRSEEGSLQYIKSIMQQDGGGKGLRFGPAELPPARIREAKSILDVKFVDEDTCMVLATTETDIRIFSRLLASDVQADNWEVHHVFDSGRMNAGMTPARLEVNGRVGRRAVAVVDDAGLGYTVLDLDAADGSVEEEGEEMDDEIMTG
ncbi:hypothetical protein PV08_03191 [Exophiala spinifera]|uniref:Anaphase-promoting complex subunit 4 n=1 Tax=Exophiala spinifera TaxID=91928 RepID=A0A0D2A1T2_9EURO|nr:uncharacterized protein PV08_03191 [Exophiala spinifera]KIW18902.1 hypothetical protein PV08_03191 [Exophiala spinifera]